MFSKRKQHQVEYNHRQTNKAILNRMKPCAQAHLKNNECEERQTDKQNAILHGSLHKLVMPSAFKEIQPNRKILLS